MIKKILVVMSILIILAIGFVLLNTFVLVERKPIKVGILYSFSGPLAISESQLADATLLAIEELNARGGLLNRPLMTIKADASSDLDTYEREAEKLITEDDVAVIFGCYTSASRKRVKTIVEKYNRLLFYPIPYEGIEESANIVYNGAAPNQLYIPAVKWCFDHLGSRFFLVGSDYIWPRVINEVMKDLIVALRGKILGEEYILLGSDEVSGIVDKIVKTKPDVILSTVVGSTNISFHGQLQSAGINSTDIPVMAFAISEVELAQMDAKQMAGHYSCWSYFQSVDSKTNKAFVKAFKEMYGKDRVINDSMESGYFGVEIWAQAVIDAQSIDTEKVRSALGEQSFEAPGGIVFIDRENLHTWKTVRIAQIRSDGQFDIVWSSEKPVRPLPFPIYRSKSDWNLLIEGLYKAWGNNWANPGK